MLSICLGELEDDRYISVPDVYFNNTYRDK